MATGFHSVETKHVAFRELYKQVPGIHGVLGIHDINKYVNMQKGTTCKNVTTCYMYSMNVDM